MEVLFGIVGIFFVGTILFLWLRAIFDAVLVPLAIKILNSDVNFSIPIIPLFLVGLVAYVAGIYFNTVTIMYAVLIFTAIYYAVLIFLGLLARLIVYIANKTV